MNSELQSSIKFKFSAKKQFSTKTLPNKGFIKLKKKTHNVICWHAAEEHRRVNFTNNKLLSQDKMGNVKKHRLTF